MLEVLEAAGTHAIVSRKARPVLTLPVAPDRLQTNQEQERIRGPLRPDKAQASAAMAGLLGNRGRLIDWPGPGLRRLADIGYRLRERRGTAICGASKERRPGRD